MTVAPAITRIGPLTQELRFATAMTGGVSLAVWMGGVARELDLVQRASRQRDEAKTLPVPGAAGPPDQNVLALYLRLLDLLDTTVDADILVGTSAGGINAAILGMARVNDLDLGGLRDMWLELGALEDLLRDPADDGPTSLLRGDDKLLTDLQAGLDGLWQGEDRTQKPWPPTSVHLTTTLIAGEAGRFTDAYGTLVQDVDHHGMFAFDEEHLATREICPALATAGRSTASFPFAFEPGFLSPVKVGGRPEMKDYANITRAHWVSDGGLLMNRPIQPMLQQVFDRRAERQVRRVLLYVIPSSGAQPDTSSTPAQAALGSELSLTEALLGDVKAVMEQSVASDLDAIRDHNDRVDSLCDTRLRMAQVGTRLAAVDASIAPAGDEPPPPRLTLTDLAMYKDYRDRHSDWFVRPIVAELMREVASRPEGELPRAWKAALAPGSEIEERCKAAAAEAIAKDWAIPVDGLDLQAPLGRFGLAAYDGAKATAIAMVRAAFVIAAGGGARERLAGRLDNVHRALGGDGAPARMQRPRVKHVVREELEKLFEAAPIAKLLPEVAADLACAYRARLDAEAGNLDEAWTRLARELRDAKGVFEEVIAAPARPAAPATAEPVAQTRRDRLSPDRALEELKAYVAFVYGGGADAIAMRLFELHVATRSVLPVSVEVDQPVEFVQLSADSRTLLSARSTAQAKLTGMQMHHFGAFYKASWRANDWTWGRIDGAGWLVHLLLDPRRIETVAGCGSADFYEKLRMAIGAGEPASGRERDRRARVIAELAFLDGAARPTSLPATALWVARELQRWIATEELPVIAEQMKPKAATSASEPASMDPWARDVLALANPERPADPAMPLQVAMGDQLASCPVPREKLAAEVGEPLMTRTVTKAAAVAGAMATAAVPPNVLKAPLSALRTVTMAVYRAVTAARGNERTLLWGGTAAVVLGLVLALTSTSLLGVAGAMIFACGLMVLAVVTWGGHTRKARIGVLVALVLGAVLAFEASREWIFGDGTCVEGSCSPDDIGWFGREALPWLAASAWNILIVFVVFGLLSAAIGALATRPWRSNGKPG